MHDFKVGPTFRKVQYFPYCSEAKLKYGSIVCRRMYHTLLSMHVASHVRVTRCYPCMQPVTYALHAAIHACSQSRTRYTLLSMHAASHVRVTRCYPCMQPVTYVSHAAIHACSQSRTCHTLLSTRLRIRMITFSATSALCIH